MFGKRSDQGYIRVLEGIEIKTIVHGQGTLMTEFRLTRDAALPEHAHEQEQTGYLLKGRIRLFIDGTSQVMTPGDSWMIPSNVQHRAEILEDSVALEVFSPCRSDYLKYVNAEDVRTTNPDSSGRIDTNVFKSEIRSSIPTSGRNKFGRIR